MNIYWGTRNSGKKHVELYANINNKTTLIGKWGNIFHKQKVNIIHNEDKWSEQIVDHILYHKQKQYDDLLQTKLRTHKIDITFLPEDGYINPNMVINKKYLKFLDRRMDCLTPDLQKYTKREYLDSLIYYKLLLRYHTEITDPIGYTMLNDNSDIILDDVDIITEPCRNNFLFQESNIPENVLKKLQSSNNIVPYKSNILDSIISKLDSFGDNTFGAYEETLFEMYDKDKNILWDFLDSYQIELNNIIKTLIEYNIPYQMFDLDNDSYKDVFGWDIDLPRDYTHKKNSWQDNERYATIVKIAQEYLA